jgi:ubiquinone/menaquinone biosynthesis C-methylase UbiE
LSNPSAREKAEADADAAATFDDIAPGYDERAGLPHQVGQSVARAVVDIADTSPGDLVVELGAGTGEIGSHFACFPLRYLGVDRSPEMLAIFRAKAGDNAPSLVVADCDRDWPLPDACASVIVASRVIHLLEPDHVAREARRVCRPGGCLVLGRVLRDPEGFKERLRHRRQQLLLEAGINPRQGEAGARRVVERCVLAGGEALGRRVVAEWNTEVAPSTIINAWAAMPRMGSFPVGSAARTSILTELREYARDEIGNLDRPQAFREQFAVDIVRWP